MRDARFARLGIIQERLELDFAVAHDVGIRGTSDSVFIQKMLEYIIPVLAREINRVQFYAETFANLLRISKIDACRTVFLGVVFLPVFHEQAFDPVSLL